MKNLLENKKNYPHPTSLAFDPAPWLDLLGSSTANAQEKSIAKIALAVGENFEAVRSGSKKTLRILPADRVLRIGSYLAYLNNAAIEVIARGRLVGASDENLFTTVLHKRIAGIAPNLDLTSDEALAGLVDSARFTLFELLHRDDSEFSGEESSDLDEAIKYHLSAGQHYHVWYDIWQDVICRGLSLGENGHLQYFRKDLVQCALIADYRVRRKLLTMSFNIEGKWGSAPPRYKLDYCDYEVKVGSDGCIRFKRSKRIQDSVPFQFIMHKAAEIELSKSVLRTKLPKYGQIEVSEIIACWRAMATVISNKVEETVIVVEDHIRSESEWSVEPTDVVFCFNRLELISDLSRATGMSKGKIAHIVNAMKLSDKVVSSLWAHPLVEIPGDRLLAINIPFLSGKYLYPIRSWISEGGGDQHKKGYEFEGEILDEFIHAKKFNSNLLHWKFFDNVTMNCGVRKEQVDLLLFTGKEVYVIEAKCFIPGYEPREVVRYMSSIEEAIEQACRKANNIALSRSKIRDFLAAKNEVVSVDLDVCPVLPLVIVYHPLGAGFGTANCPVVDITTIERFLGNEEPSAFIRNGKEMRRVGVVRPLYTSRDGADALFPEYMKAPPILEQYKRQLVDREIPLMASDGSLSGFILDYFDVAPDQAEIDLFRRMETGSL
jgi:hypothetical protein